MLLSMSVNSIDNFVRKISKILTKYMIPTKSWYGWDLPAKLRKTL